MITNDIGARMLAKIWALLKVPLNRSIASALKIPIPSRHYHHHYHHSDHSHHHYHHPDHHHIIIIVNIISFAHLPIWTLIFHQRQNAILQQQQKTFKVTQNTILSAFCFCWPLLLYYFTSRIQCN